MLANGHICFQYALNSVGKIEIWLFFEVSLNPIVNGRRYWRLQRISGTKQDSYMSNFQDIT